MIGPGRLRFEAATNAMPAPISTRPPTTMPAMAPPLREMLLPAGPVGPGLTTVTGALATPTVDAVTRSVADAASDGPSKSRYCGVDCNADTRLALLLKVVTALAAT